MKRSARRMNQTPRLWLAATLGAAFLWCLPAAQTVGQEVWTVEDCAACHEAQVDHFERSPHAAIRLEDEAALSCSACHGDPTAHIEEGGDGPIQTFGAGEFPKLESQVCQGCHSVDHPRFLASTHAKAGLACSSCHSVHSPKPSSLALLRSNTENVPRDEGNLASQSCRGCHDDVFAQFAFNERHRLQEGILDCTSCHNPHEPSPRLALGGFKQQACVDCHTDKDGPFIFEHGSSRVDGCVSCHTPHGSPNRHLLKFQNVADACYSCHISVPGFHTRFTSETQCTNCHSAIHGSNFDQAFLK